MGESSSLTNRRKGFGGQDRTMRNAAVVKEGGEVVAVQPQLQSGQDKNYKVVRKKLQTVGKNF